jgi:iron complex transport system substrate-binding protein
MQVRRSPGWYRCMTRYSDRRAFLKGVTAFATTSRVSLAAPPAHASASFPRIAAPDRAGAQTLLSLGVTPVASVSRDFFNMMGTTPAMPEGVIDCGDPIEPNLEVLQRLHVDLIVTVTISADIRAVLQRVAPVTGLEIYSGAIGALERAKTETLRLADMIGKRIEGVILVHDVNQLIEQQRDRIPREPRRVFLVALAGDGRNMTVYARNSIMYDVMQEMGIENAWKGSTNEFGFANAGVEELAAEPDASIMHIDYGFETDAALLRLAQSPFWTNLPMVRAGRLYRVPRFEVFGGLPLASQFARQIADCLMQERPT